MTTLSPRSQPWRSQDVRSTRRHFAALAALAWITVAAGPAPPALIVDVAGDVEIGRGDPASWEPARAGDRLSPADRIRTGHDGRVELQLDGAVVRLYANSLLRLPAADTQRVRLDRGDSLFEVRKQRPGQPFEVETPEAIVSVKGTRFSVSFANGGVGVAVFRGRVDVAGAHFPPDLSLGAGFRAAGGADAGFQLHTIDGADPWGGWARGQALSPALAAPPPAPAAAAVGPARNVVPDRVPANRASVSETARLKVDVLAPVRAEPALTKVHVEPPAVAPQLPAAAPAARVKVSDSGAVAPPKVELDGAIQNSAAVAERKMVVVPAPGRVSVQKLESPETNEDPGGIVTPPKP